MADLIDAEIWNTALEEVTFENANVCDLYLGQGQFKIVSFKGTNFRSCGMMMSKNCSAVDAKTCGLFDALLDWALGSRGPRQSFINAEDIRAFDFSNARLSRVDLSAAKQYDVDLFRGACKGDHARLPIGLELPQCD